MKSVILLVRSRQELTDDVQHQLSEKFGEVEFLDVEPRTPEELDELVVKHSATAVVLRENPLPLLAMKRVPCIPLRPGYPLVRMTGLDVQVEEL